MSLNLTAVRRTFAALLFAPLSLWAQGLPDTGPVERPGGGVPLAPRFGEPVPEPRIAVPEPKDAPDPKFMGPIRVLVREVRIEGVTVLDERELREVTAGYLNRIVAAEDLYELAYRLTRLYVERGYVNSGFVLPDQEITGGQVILQAIEGRLNEVVVAEGGRLRPSYLTSRALRGNEGVLNLNTLRETLSVLQQDVLIEQINAEIAPGARPGEALLRLRVQEADPLSFGLSYGNSRSPSVGAERAEAFFVHRNATGNADRVELRYGESRGINDHALAYTVPVTAADTAITIRDSKTRSLVIEAPFDALSIEAETKATSVGVTQPLLRDTRQQVTGGILFETKSTQTLLLGVPFSFSAGVPNGRSEISMWRGSLDYLRRSSEEVLAARLTLNSGQSNTASPKLGAAGPDRAFFYMLFQSQWARRLSASGNQLILRFDWQESRNSLLAAERFGLGGASTVRGFRENQLLRDRGLFGSVEYRHTVLADDSVIGRVQFAGFFDHGRSENLDGTAGFPKAISGAGLGILANPNRRLSAQVFFARGSRKFPGPASDLQDRGVHFMLTLQY